MDDKLIMLTFDEDGKAEIYDDEFDITIHCTSQEDHDEVLKILRSVNWIPCSERLPEIPDGYPHSELRRSYFLVSLKSGCVESLGFDFDEMRWHVTGSPVIAWMPLPEPWEGPEIDCSKLTRDEIAQILLQWLKTHPGCRIRTDLEVRQGEPEPKNFVEFQCGNITEVF